MAIERDGDRIENIREEGDAAPANAPAKMATLLPRARRYFPMGIACEGMRVSST